MKASHYAKRRALSPIVGTILVVAMTIAGAGILYTYFTTVATRAQVTNQIQVSADVAVPNGSGTGTAAVTVTNSGSVALTGVTLSGSLAPATVTWSPAPSSTSPLPPGSTTSTTFSTPGSVTAGNSYAMTITATFANGATTAQVVTVAAH